MLCDFHRKQAWQRFVRQHASGLRQHEENITEDMDRIAYSMSPAEYRAAVQVFKSRSGSLRSWVVKVLCLVSC